MKLATFLASAAIFASAEASAAPNIVVIMTDDQPITSFTQEIMPKTFASIVTPGLKFTNAFAEFSLCCPSRSSFLNGRQAARNDISKNNCWKKFEGAGSEQDTLASWLQTSGYQTGFFGKYLNGYGIDSPSHRPPHWNKWYAFTKDLSFYYGFNFYTTEDGGPPNFHDDSETEFAADLLTRRAVAFIQDQGTAPFFMWIVPTNPHGIKANPLTALTAPRHSGLFTTYPLPQSPAFNEADVSDKPGYIVRKPLWSASNISDEQSKYRSKMRSLQSVDDMVESVIAALTSQGKIDNTVLIFTSDNGYTHGDHRWDSKRILYEEAYRIPLVITGPGVNAGSSDALVSHIDLTATIAALAGATTPPIDGHSLVPLLIDPQVSWRSAMFAEGRNREKQYLDGVRTKTRQYIKTFDTDNFEELYDLETDPYELSNLVNNSVSGHPTYNSAYQADLDALRASATTLRQCSGTNCWVP